MKKKKLVVSELKVQSFITSLHRDSEKTVKGGITGTICTVCNFSDQCVPASEDCFTANTCSIPGAICNTNPGPGGNNNQQQVNQAKG